MLLGMGHLLVNSRVESHLLAKYWELVIEVLINFLILLDEGFE